MPKTRRLVRRLATTGIVAAAAITPMAAGGAAHAAISYCAPPADTVPPQVSSLTLSTQSVDVAGGPATVIVTAHATDTAANDAASGVKRIDVDLHGPRTYASVSLSLTSGTAEDGTWQGTQTIPRIGRDGVWKVEFVEAVDAAHNFQNYVAGGKYPSMPTDIRLQPGWVTSFTVSGAEPPVIVKPGKLTDFTLSPSSVNTTRHAKQVKVSAAFSRPRPQQVRLSFYENGKGARAYYKNVALTRSTHGRWTGAVTVRRYVGDGKAQAQLSAQYGAGVRPAYRNYDYDQLAARHLPSGIRITSGVDKTKPVLNTLTITPSPVDTTAGTQDVTVTATATDTKSGVKRINASMYLRQTGGFKPGGFANLRLTRNGSQWTGQTKIRECAPSGDWRVSAYVTDHANNQTFYSSKTLTAAGLPGELTVISTPGDVTAPTVDNATASSAQHTITLDFSEGVKDVNTSTLTVFARHPAAARFQHDVAISAITCSNGSITVDCSGTATGGLVTSAVLTVPAIAVGKEYQVWANLDSVTLQLTDAAGNPLDWSYEAADVTGS
jgi:hypothetical protein